MGEVPDGPDRLGVDAGGDELDQSALQAGLLRVDHPESAVTRPTQLRRGLHDPPQHVGEAQIGGERDDSVEQARGPVDRGHHAKSRGRDAGGRGQRPGAGGLNVPRQGPRRPPRRPRAAPRRSRRRSPSRPDSRYGVGTAGAMHQEDPMTTSQRPLHNLSRKECLEFLQYHSFVGRLGFVLDGRPMVLPVNYLADEEAVVFCTTEGTTLSAVAEGSEVVFEVDDSHPLERSGWSVVVAARREWSPIPARSMPFGAALSAPGRPGRPSAGSGSPSRRSPAGAWVSTDPARGWAQIAARKRKPSRATATITSRAVRRPRPRCRGCAPGVPWTHRRSTTGAPPGSRGGHRSGLTTQVQRADRPPLLGRNRAERPRITEATAPIPDGRRMSMLVADGRPRLSSA